MDNIKTGRLIYQLRKNNNLTQKQLADKMNISDKTVSKWERGLGCPELSLLQELSVIFNVDIDRLISGELNPNKVLAGNMKKVKFYICPDCGNIITALTETDITCCGKIVKPSEPVKACADEKLNTEIIENDLYITTSHPMERGHYISFVALQTADSFTIKKLYPQWEMQVRMPLIYRGKLIWYCSRHGLFYMDI